MKILCVLSRYNYGDPRRGEGYEYTNFVPALRRLGHEISLFENWDRSCCHDFRALNEALLRTVERQRPDVVFSVLIHYEIWRETWLNLRDAGIAATVNWSTDDSWRYAQFSRYVAPTFHAFITTYPSAFARYQKDGIPNVLLTQWAANAESLQSPLPASECQFPISFVGTAHGDRHAWVEELRRRGIEVTCFGQGWQNGPVAAADIPRIIRNSAISLNLANSVWVWDGLLPHHTNQIKARTFEVPGAGGFLLTEWADGIERYYEPGKQLVIFHSLDEAVEKIHYYLAHPAERDAIANAGYERTCTEHTYDQRLAAVLEFALQQREDYFARREIPHPHVDWVYYEASARLHTLNRRLKLLKRVLTSAAILVWGPVRGPRAARRIVFEFSWRLSGAHTYSAAGWPGRMFYEAS